MRALILRMIAPGILLVLTTGMQSQSDPAKTFKTSCTMCHSADGSGDNPTGKALHAKDLRSEDVQKQSDVVLGEVITKGRGKMPAFGAKIKPDDVQQLVAYIRSLAKK